MTAEAALVYNVPPENQTIFTEPGVGWKYLQISISSFVGFWFILYAWRYFFDWYKRNDTNYKNFPENFKWYYVQNYAGNVHHLSIFTYCIYSLFTVKCGNKGNTMIAAVNGDMLCLLSAQKEAVFGMVFTMGYLVYDLFVQVFWCQDAQDMLGQIIFHHCSIFIGMVLTMWLGYGFVVVGLFLLTIEISTIFFNYRSNYTREELSKPLPTLIQVIFFITFTISRMCFIPYYLYMQVEIGYYLWDVLSPLKKVSFCYVCFVFVAIYCIHI